MLIGSHVGMSGKEMFLGSVQEMLSYRANVCMIYTGAPQNTRRKKMEELRIEEGQALLKEHGYTMDHVVVHAPYIINLGNSIKKETYEIAVQFLKTEIERTAKLGANQIVLHPGSHVQEGSDVGIEWIIKGLNEVLADDPHDNVRIALETMSGKGSECGRTFEELQQIIEGVDKPERLSVCFDTCHVHDAGYDIVNDYEGVLQHFDEVIGLDRISVLHVNDSKNLREAHKDRHENFGFGHIGFETLVKFCTDDRFKHIPKILETPYVPLTDEKKAAKVPPYAFEIAMIQAGAFDENLKSKIIQEAL